MSLYIDIPIQATLSADFPDAAVDRDQGNFARAQTFQRQADQCQTSIRTRMPSTTVLISEFE